MNYKFTSDWFTPNLSMWEKMLLSLDGTSCHLLEIGSWEGRSAMWMADNLLRDRDSRLYCIDPWRDASGRQNEIAFDNNVAQCERRLRINKYKGYSFDVLPLLTEGHFDFAYIDGSHEARDVVTDFVLTLPLMKPGAKICFDDYEWGNPHGTLSLSPGTGIDAILNMWADKVKVLYKGYQVWIEV